MNTRTRPLDCEQNIFTIIYIRYTRLFICNVLYTIGRWAVDAYPIRVCVYKYDGVRERQFEWMVFSCDRIISPSLSGE